MPYRRYRISIFPEHCKFRIPLAVPLTAFCNHPHVAYLIMKWDSEESDWESFKVVTKPQQPLVSLKSSLFIYFLHISWICFVGAILLCNKRLENCSSCDSCLPCDQESCCCLQFLKWNHLSLIVLLEPLQWENKKNYSYLVHKCTHKIYETNLELR